LSSTTPSVHEMMVCALQRHTAIPGFNIPYLPMMEPVVRALRDTRCFGLIMVARLEWEKFASGGVKPIYDRYQQVKDEQFTRLHLDHVPVIDEDNLLVDYEAILGEAAMLGYDSIMIDGSRLSLDDNIAATRRIVDMAHASDVAVEAELGAVMGHESGPMPPYEELFASGKGFTDPDEAKRFVAETGVDWLSVAIGSVHGAISTTARREKKLEARLSIERLDALREATGIPLVLHGGTGIKKECVLESVRHGIAKINIATAIRQPYEALMEESPEAALEAVYEATVSVVRDDLELMNSVDILNPGK
jgi:fructose-bisphosphate aldolase, class II